MNAAGANSTNTVKKLALSLSGDGLLCFKDLNALKTLQRRGHKIRGRLSKRFRCTGIDERRISQK